MKVVLSDLILHVNKNELVPAPDKKRMPISVTVSCVLGDRELATASADRLSRRTWNVSRVFVPRNYRSQGVGGLLLERLKKEMSLMGQFKSLSVAAGGYNSDLSRLERFYTRCGFKKKEENFYVWIKSTAAAGRQPRADSRSDGAAE